MPVHFQYGTPDFSPILQGKTFIVHVASIANGVFSLYPPNFLSTVSTLVSENKNHRKTTYSHIYKFIVEIIAHYINKFDSTMVDKLLYLYEKKDELNASKFKFREFMFYLYPILGYIIHKTLEKLASKNPYAKLR